MNTPECDKLSKIASQSQICGEFLEWLRERYTLVRLDDEWIPDRCDKIISTKKLLAEFFDIDTEKLEQEKMAILAACRRNERDVGNEIKHDAVRRMKKQPTAVYDPRNFDHEAGDRVYIWVKFQETATMVDLVESRGWGKKNSGVLTPKPVAQNGQLRIAVIREGIWYWVGKTNESH